MVDFNIHFTKNGESIFFDQEEWKWEIFAGQQNGNGAPQVASDLEQRLAKSGGERAPLNLIDETVLVEDYPSLFSANFPSLRIEKRDDSSLILLPFPRPRSPCSSARFTGNVRERKEGRKAIAGCCNKCPAISKRREGHDEETIDFPRISISNTEAFGEKRFETVGRKIQPILSFGFTIDLSRNSVGRTISNPAIDSDNTRAGCVECLPGSSWSYRNRVISSFWCG